MCLSSKEKVPGAEVSEVGDTEWSGTWEDPSLLISLKMCKNSPHLLNYPYLYVLVLYGVTVR